MSTTPKPHSGYSFFPARRVKPHALWIGSMKDSMDTQAAARHGVGLVVNCTRDLPFVVPGVARYRVPVDDHPDDARDMLLHLAPAVREIDKALHRGDGVLVHCFAGVSRSASVVAAYLMYREGLTPLQAMQRVREAKPETFAPHANFAGALEAFRDDTAVLSARGRRTGSGTTRA
jgi:dual specificity phosphatase 12